MRKLRDMARRLSPVAKKVISVVCNVGTSLIARIIFEVLRDFWG